MLQWGGHCWLLNIPLALLCMYVFQMMSLLYFEGCYGKSVCTHYRSEMQIYPACDPCLYVYIEVFPLKLSAEHTCSLVSLQYIRVSPLHYH